LQLPWVADFRDPWMENPFIKFPTKFHRQINGHLEHSVFCEADRVILNTDASRDRYRIKYSSLPADRMITIPNGYDEPDLAIKKQPNRVESVFTVAHIGSLYQKTRSSEFFLRALYNSIRDKKIPAGKIKIRFIGSIDKETRGLVRQFNLDDNIEIRGYLPHHKALEEIYTADLLLLIPSYGSGAELFVPAKIYEYLASRKPILCLADPGACADLILRSRSGYTVPPTDPIKIADKLGEMYHLWENGELIIDPDMDLISIFECRKLTGRLAALLTEVCA
jgi:glycosyltransferase involved in cell wall biosynthesis